MSNARKGGEATMTDNGGEDFETEETEETEAVLLLMVLLVLVVVVADCEGVRG